MELECFSRCYGGSSSSHQINHWRVVFPSISLAYKLPNLFWALFEVNCKSIGCPIFKNFSNEKNVWVFKHTDLMFECTHKIIKLCFRIYLQSLSLNFFKLYRKYNAQDLLNIFIHFCLEDIRGDWDILGLFDIRGCGKNSIKKKTLSVLIQSISKYLIQRTHFFISTLILAIEITEKYQFFLFVFS